MGQDLDTMTYMMAAEKMCNLIFTMENTFDFLDEYKVKPDDSVKKALIPLLDKLKKWTQDGVK